ncbi:origin recognition complex subunit 1 [Rhinatrema bivittatum]|uniref:origin recognition complex subunit 1 n=1 Tax=Rhinatrema bivittatum TaxID=194408 RepID=UPI00112B2F65|nr:origin recognition complex subunit 1 [Rhinatrema bivittatum]
MSKYFTRLKKRRIYSWIGKPTLKDRKLKTSHYRGLLVKSEENAVGAHVNLEDYILVEGDVDDRPYVARLLQLYENGTEPHPAMRAVVQWFIRFEEVPVRKRKLLEREAHPREIFLYQVPDCDGDIDAETIVGTVQVTQLTPDAQPPGQKRGDEALFVKLSWDGKSFQPLPCDLLSGSQVRGEGAARRRSPAPPPPALPRRSIGVDIICALEVDTTGRVDRSAAKARPGGAEMESTCLLSKERGTRRQVDGSSSPVARKRLQLSSPAKSPGRKLTRQDVLEQLLDTDAGIQPLDSEASKQHVAFTELSESPKGARGEEEAILCLKLGPLRSPRDCQPVGDEIRLTPHRQSMDSSPAPKTRREPESCPEPIVENKVEEEAGRASRSKRSHTPKKQVTTPKRHLRTCVREVDHVRKKAVTETPRSQRKCAQESSARIRQQLRLLGSRDDLEDKDGIFVPDKSVHDSSSSGEEDEMERDQRGGMKSRPIPGTPATSRTPSARTPAKTPKTPVSKTPKTPRLATPRIPERSQPPGKPGSVLEEARLRLHVSAVPESLPCREQEFQDIYNFVESKIIDGTGGCMYISGVPGTGKTATVHEVIHCLQRAVEEDELPSFQCIEINGMKLTDPHQTYVQILKLLTGQKATADHAAALLEKRFCTPAPKREVTVLLVDELDLLWTRKQNVMYNLFDWPTHKQAKLIVLTIANTMDLPERIMMNRVASRLGLTRMSFQPYSYKQLQQIITSRLNHIKAFEDDAIQLVSRKVAALSGDARRCLDICRRATEIVELSNRKTGSRLVTMTHVMEALEEMFSSPFVTAIRHASLQEQLFLRAALTEFRRSGLEEATFQQINHQHVTLCRMEGLAPPTMSETMGVCLRLGACRLLLVEPSKNDLHLRVRLNVSQDDVMYALKEK